jgi:hypothetical protein
MEDERSLGIINSKLVGIQRNLAKAPEKFGQCNEKLAKINDVYNRLRSLALSPGNSLQNFTDTSSRLDSEYKQATREFKAGLPEEIMAELLSAGKKYKGLRPLLNS